MWNWMIILFIWKLKRETKIQYTKFNIQMCIILILKKHNFHKISFHIFATTSNNFIMQVQKLVLFYAIIISSVYFKVFAVGKIMNDYNGVPSTVDDRVKVSGEGMWVIIKWLLMYNHENHYSYIHRIRPQWSRVDHTICDGGQGCAWDVGSLQLFLLCRR